jgi:hypothetical protein
VAASVESLGVKQLHCRPKSAFLGIPRRPILRCSGIALLSFTQINPTLTGSQPLNSSSANPGEENQLQRSYQLDCAT